MSETGWRALAASVIYQALMNATEPYGDLGKRARAAAWLASDRATPWFQMVDLDQCRVLMESDWRDYAEMILEKGNERRRMSGTTPVKGEYEAVLTDTLDYLDTVERRKAA